MFPIFTNCFVSSDDSSLFICLSVQLEIEPQDCAGDSNSARPFSPSPTMRNGLNGTTQNATTEREERVQEKWTGQRERERREDGTAGWLSALSPSSLRGSPLSLLCSHHNRAQTKRLYLSRAISPILREPASLIRLCPKGVPRNNIPCMSDRGQKVGHPNTVRVESANSSALYRIR